MIEIKVKNEIITCVDFNDSVMLAGCKSGNVLKWIIPNNDWKKILETPDQYVVFIFLNKEITKSFDWYCNNESNIILLYIEKILYH